VQQSSDVTYRIFDYNRPGMDGKPRKLHTELAAQALDFKVMDEYRTVYSEFLNNANLVISSPYFSVRVLELSQPMHRNLVKYDSFIISMCVRGECTIKIRATGHQITLSEGHTCFIPAEIADYDVIPLTAKTKVLDAFIDNKDRSFTRRVTRFLHISQK
jgi:mannose-6-phosphate isomerase